MRHSTARRNTRPGLLATGCWRTQRPLSWIPQKACVTRVVFDASHLRHTFVGIKSIRRCLVPEHDSLCQSEDFRTLVANPQWSSRAGLSAVSQSNGTLFTDIALCEVFHRELTRNTLSSFKSRCFVRFDARRESVDQRARWMSRIFK